MAMSVDGLRAWLNDFDDDAIVSIDSGGLFLLVEGEDAYCEVGGVSEDYDEDGGVE